MKYSLIDGILYKFSGGCDLLVVLKGLQTEIIKDAHEKGHFSVKRTEEVITQKYYQTRIYQIYVLKLHTYCRIV